MKIIILTNLDVGLYNFRKELLERLVDDKHEVIISLPQGELIPNLQAIGCKFIQTEFDRRGMNPLADMKLLMKYRSLLKTEKPDIVLTYTIKPNLYGGMACAALRIPYVANITGLGTAVEQPGIMQKGLLFFYRYALRKAQRAFCQNEDIELFLKRHHIAVNKLALLPGSGVNLERFSVLPYPGDNRTEFVFISRIMKEKGIDLYLKAAEVIKSKYPNTVFHVCGFCEQDYEQTLQDMDNRGVIVYHGMVRDIREILKDVHCTIHPSYYPEGISNVLLESAACGRPVITTNRSGCRETVDDSATGYVVPIKEEAPLVKAIERFMALKWEQKRDMGLAGRDKMERQFDRDFVVRQYLSEIRKV